MSDRTEFSERGRLLRVALGLARRQSSLRQLIALTLFPWFVLGKGTLSFRLNERAYRYFYHRYNYTWLNERCVEIPIARRVLREHSGRKILEIGNVLSHYFPVRHTIVDKYEMAKGILNEDVASFQTGERYDLILGISTLEHVGFDETPQDPLKPLAALENLKSLLTDRGQILLTIPLGYNPHLDTFTREDKLGLTRQSYLVRTGRANAWREAQVAEVHDAKYGGLYPAANALLVGTFSRI